MAKRKHKTDFTEQRERDRHVRSHLERALAKIREQEARRGEATESR